MTNKQRFLTALRCEVPDVVPVAPLIHCRYAHKVLGRSDWRSIFEVHRSIGTVHFRGPIHPGLNVSLPSGWGVESKLVEKLGTRETRERIIRTPRGILRGRHTEGILEEDPLVGREIEFPIKSRNDWETYRLYLEQVFASITGYDTSEMDEAFDLMGEDGVPSVGIGCSLNQLLMMRGAEDLLFDLVDAPDVIRPVWETHRAVVEKYLESFLASRNEVLWLDIWSTGVLNAELFRKWILPEVAVVVDRVRGVPGRYVGLYAVGKIRHMLPMIAEVRPHLVEPFEPYPMGNVSLREVKASYGGRFCIMGNFDTPILAFGSVEKARREVLRCLDEAMEGGGYVLATSDEVPANTRPENLKAMIETTAEFGRY